MNRNKKTKNLKQNKALENMDSTNNFDVLKPLEHKETTNTNSKKNESNLF
jgi:hypothetical protein